MFFAQADASTLRESPKTSRLGLRHHAFPVLSSAGVCVLSCVCVCAVSCVCVCVCAGTCFQLSKTTPNEKRDVGLLLVPKTIGSPVGGPHSAGEIRGAAAVNVLSRVFAFAAHGGALGWKWR
jgi:hypothetical protein